MRWMVALSFVLTGFLWLRQLPPQPHDVRTELLTLMQKNNELYRSCMDNLENQFTPGYRASEIFAFINSPCGPRPQVRMTQGQLRETQNPWDVAIQGNGFFLLSDGTLTRDGQWAWRAERCWVGKERKLCVMGAEGPLTIPKDGTDLEVTPQGQVSICRLTGDGKQEECGRLVLVDVPYPAWLRRVGNNFQVTAESGPLQPSRTPCHNGLGAIAQGHLELSNVNPLEQLKTAEAIRSYAGLLGAPIEGACR